MAHHATITLAHYVFTYRLDPMLHPPPVNTPSNSGLTRVSNSITSTWTNGRLATFIPGDPLSDLAAFLDHLNLDAHIPLVIEHSLATANQEATVFYLSEPSTYPLFSTSLFSVARPIMRDGGMQGQPLVPALGERDWRSSGTGRAGLSDFELHLVPGPPVIVEHLTGQAGPSTARRAESLQETAVLQQELEALAEFEIKTLTRVPRRIFEIISQAGAIGFDLKYSKALGKVILTGPAWQGVSPVEVETARLILEQASLFAPPPVSTELTCKLVQAWGELETRACDWYTLSNWDHYLVLHRLPNNVIHVSDVIDRAFPPLRNPPSPHELVRTPLGLVLALSCVPRPAPRPLKPKASRRSDTALKNTAALGARTRTMAAKESANRRGGKGLKTRSRAGLGVSGSGVSRVSD